MRFGTFICSAAVLTVLYIVQSQYTPPKIIKPVKKITENILPDTAHTLYCTAEASPDPQYRWTFNNDAVPADVTVNENTGELSIAKFGDGDEGNYQCLVENEISPRMIAVAMSPVISLQKVRLGAEWPDSTQVDVTRTVGDYLKLTCDNAPESVPKAHYAWYLAEGETSEAEVKTTDRIYNDEEGSLHFVYVKQEDQNNNLRYKCGIYNSELDIIKLGSEKNLVVTAVSGAIPQTKARVEFFTNPARFLRTEDAVLECVFSGFPIPTITWLDKDKEQIASNNRYRMVSIENGRKLIIYNLREEDEGIYTCKGTNSGGVDEAAIFLDITSGPIWVESLSSQKVLEGKEAVFTCKARPSSGDIDLHPPIWFKNGVRMTVTNDAKYEFSDSSRVLTVKNVNKDSDIMCFQCNVSNAIGYEFGNGCLNVIEPIVVTTKPILEQYISKGDQVDLTVTGTTDPAFNLTYRWHFRNITYNSPKKPPFVFVNGMTMQAYIKTSDLSDDDYLSINGTYIRELYHLYDKLNVSIVVVVKELSGCPDGRYGRTCGSLCDVRCMTCHQDTGDCIFCKYGWKGRNCEGCPDGRYGRTCGSLCDVRCMTCHQDTGDCIFCKYGWKGRNCEVSENEEVRMMVWALLALVCLLILVVVIWFIKRQQLRWCPCKQSPGQYINPNVGDEQGRGQASNIPLKEIEDPSGDSDSHYYAISQ